MVQIGGIQKFSTVDYPGYTCASIFTIGCTMRCGYCHNPELVLPEQFLVPIPEEDILGFLERRRGLLGGVCISGGEPTMQADLPAFIRRIKAMGYLVKLDSNGTNPVMIKQLIDEKLIDFVAMDIKGPLDKYQQIAARPVAEADILESIKQAQRVGHEFRTTVVRSQLTPEDFEQIGQMVKGADRFALQHFLPGTTVSPQFARAETFSDSEFEQAAAIMRRYVKECVVH